MRIVRFVSGAYFLVGSALGGPTLLSGCGSSYQEGTSVVRTPAQEAGEKASMKGMMEAMKTKAKKR
jgi:hypothetical protein